MDSIRRMVAHGVVPRVIAGELGLTIRAVQRLAGKIRSEPGFRSLANSRRPGAKLAAAEVSEVQRLAISGLNFSQISEQLGLDRDTVAKVARPALAERGVRLRGTPQTVTSEMVSAIEALVAAGLSEPAIGRRLGISAMTAHRHARRYRQRMDLAPTKWIGRNTSRPTDEQLSGMRELIRARKSARDIAAALGISRSTVLKHGRGLIEAGRASGERCTCGRPLWHEGGCRRWSRWGALSFEVRDNVVDMLHGGKNIAQVREETGHSWAVLKSASADFWMTPAGAARARERDALLDSVAADRSARKHAWRTAQAQRTRAQRARERSFLTSQASATRGDALFRTILTAVPRWLDPAIRDDVASEVYVAVLAGDITETSIASNMKRFVGAATDMWADRFRSRSMDAPIVPDSHITLGDTFDDPAGAAIIDEITLAAIARRAGPASRGYWLMCRCCSHPWIIAPQRAGLSEIRTAALQATCPECGSNHPRVPAQSGGLLMEGLTA